jgi:basic membrane protein A and related proteins
MGGAVVALAAVIALAIATGGFAASAKKSETTKAAVITDIGGLGDKGFNDLCAKGVNTAKKQLGIGARVFISKSSADYIPNLSTAARQGYNPVVVCGFLMGGDIEKAAKKYPNTSFGIIDYSQTWMKSNPQNLRGALFSENESGYLMGVAAAMATKTNGVSAVGGQAVPAVVAYLAGFKAGAKATKKGIKVQTAYSESFTDQAKCKEIALNQIAAGSGAVFQAAGSCGLGALQGAKEQGVWGIGVDTDQGFLGSFVLTSALKLVDLGVFRMIRDVKEGTFAGGGDSLYTVKNGGVGFGKVSSAAPNRKAIVAKLTAVSKLISAGKIKPPKK